MIRSGMPEGPVREVIGSFHLDIRPFDEEAAYVCERLRPATRRLGLSLGDRACLALGLTLSRRVVTTEKEWKRLDLGVRVVVTR